MRLGSDKALTTSPRLVHRCVAIYTGVAHPANRRVIAPVAQVPFPAIAVAVLAPFAIGWWGRFHLLGVLAFIGIGEGLHIVITVSTHLQTRPYSPTISKATSQYLFDYSKTGSPVGSVKLVKDEDKYCPRVLSGPVYIRRLSCITSPRARGMDSPIRGQHSQSTGKGPQVPCITLIHARFVGIGGRKMAKLEINLLKALTYTRHTAT